MEFIEQFAPIAAVVVVCVFVGMFLKWLFNANDRLTAAIPWILAATGGILGIIAKFIMPEYGDIDTLTAIAVGIVSGLASGGAYQIYHQYEKLKDEDNKDE